jgi:regulator of protease activity HflC (stomatin/prohibitin superfamily)
MSLPNLPLQIPTKLLAVTVGSAATIGLGYFLFKGIWFYNESGYMSHVRTIFGDEKIVEDVGYSTKFFGRATPWKKALSIQSVLKGQTLPADSDDDLGANTTIAAFPMVFLGNVDADVEFSVRFRLPGENQFLKIAQEYRTPENFINTALIPAIKETLQATASLMSADDYYAGARSEFGAEFENQLNNGIYLIKRKEVDRSSLRGEKAVIPPGQDQMGLDDSSVVMVTEKVTDSKGIPVSKQQQFRKFDVEVVEARITNVDPNPQYKGRMVKVQTALAELAVARQNKLKEQEEKLLVTARGEKEVEVKRQETLRDQIERTTKAETQKKLTLIDATRQNERAAIEQKTAAIALEKAKIDAQAVKVTADAEAYAKNAVIEADGALDKKLATFERIHQYWAAAATTAPVPSIVMGGGGSSTSGRNDEVTSFMDILKTKAAKDLALEMKIKQ